MQVTIIAFWQIFSMTTVYVYTLLIATFNSEWYRQIDNPRENLSWGIACLTTSILGIHQEFRKALDKFSVRYCHSQPRLKLVIH